jgi:hypothetical protein
MKEGKKTGESKKNIWKKVKDRGVKGKIYDRR